VPLDIDAFLRRSGSLPVVINAPIVPVSRCWKRLLIGFAFDRLGWRMRPALLALPQHGTGSERWDGHRA
jgi:hypothetical protein